MSQLIWNRNFIARAILGKNRVVVRGVRMFTYAGGIHSVSELSSSSDCTGSDSGQGSTWLGGGAPCPVRLQDVCGFFALPFWQERQPPVWFAGTIAECLSIATFTLLWLRNSTRRIFSSRTFARGFLISCCIFSIVAHENPLLPILAIFKARCMSDYSSCTRPPFLAIIADMLKTSRKLVSASTVRYGYYFNHITLLRMLWFLQCMFPPVPRTVIMKFICENPRRGNIVLFNFADCADKCSSGHRRFAVMGNDILVT